MENEGFLRAFQGLFYCNYRNSVSGESKDSKLSSSKISSRKFSYIKLLHGRKAIS